ncbi:MAG: AmmeMemoRadiSam system protein A [Synergistaceae bacterium]|nr:AmmeMemoRadiSam system protein A [Synergistaceae bacterium]
MAYASLHAAPDLARSVISRFFEKEGDSHVKEAERFLRFPELRKKSACFISLKKSGDLRGCIGTIFPRSGSLAMEICENAIAAAFHDPRFPPLSRGELDTVSISVDILSTTEQITGIEELNPSKYGVVVEKNGARGVLLPDLEGVETVEQQLSIAARKAGITTLQGALISRFSVLRVREAGRI